MMVKGGKMDELIYTAKIKDNMNLVYPSKTEQKVNFVYTALSEIARNPLLNSGGMIYETKSSGV